MGILSGLFGSKSTATVVDSLADAGDRLFTSDDERLKWQTMMTQIKEQPHAMSELANVIAASSTSPFVAGGRSALLYCVSLVLFYQLALRDVLVITLNRHDMCAPLITGDMLQSILKMIFGGM